MYTLHEKIIPELWN